MKSLKNLFFGFLVSFIGSVPLGYLNIIGYEIYIKSGMDHLIPYLLGVLCIEAVVIYGTFVFASALMERRNLIKGIDFFSIFFMLALAYFFYNTANETLSTTTMSVYLGLPAFVIGLVLSGLNFVQIPFWISWNLYLVSNNHVNVGKYGRLIYILGTLAGTFCGMLALILSLRFITTQEDDWSKSIMTHVIPAFFLVMALFQAFKFWRKYYSAKAPKN